MSDQEQAFIDKLQTDTLKLRLFVKWFVGIASSLVVALLIGYGSLGAMFNNYIIKHEAEVTGFKEQMGNKVDNAVLLEYMKYNDKYIKLVLDGVEKNSEEIFKLRNEIKAFELKYFAQNIKRNAVGCDDALYIPNLHWFVCGNDTLFESLQIAYKSKIGLY